MIHAITCSLVLTSGAGTSRSGPRKSMISAVYRRVSFSSSVSESRLRIADHAALGAAERNVHHRAFPGHPRCQRAHFVQRHVGREADAALGRPARQRMLHPVAGEHLDASIVQLHRNVYGDLLGWRVRSTLHMPSSSLSRMAASSNRPAAASQGFFSFSSDMEVGDVRVATIILRFHYPSTLVKLVGRTPWSAPSETLTKRPTTSGGCSRNVP